LSQSSIAVLRHGYEERVERPEAVPPEQPVLLQHQPLRADAGVRGREPVVPDERHALDERAVRAHHAVEPPEVVVAPGVERRDRMSVVVDRLRAEQAVAGRTGQRVDGAVQALLREAHLLVRAGSEAGAPKEPFGFLRAEVAPVNGNSGCARHWAIPLSPSALHVLG
jgi:hypothetical protein